MNNRASPTPSIRTAAQIRALASPLRQEILDTLDAVGPCSIAQLAEHLGRAPDTLYFHVKHLLRTRLVVEKERKQLGRHVFAIYDLVARPMRIDRRKASRKDMLKVAGGILRLALRDYGRGFDHTSAEFEGSGRNHWVARAQGYLDASGIAELNERMESLLEFVRSTPPRRGSTPIAFAFAFTPIALRRGVKGVGPTRRNRGAPARSSAPSRSTPTRRNGKPRNPKRSP